MSAMVHRESREELIIEIRKRNGAFIAKVDKDDGGVALGDGVTLMDALSRMAANAGWVPDGAMVRGQNGGDCTTSPYKDLAALRKWRAMLLRVSVVAGRPPPKPLIEWMEEVARDARSAPGAMDLDLAGVLRALVDAAVLVLAPEALVAREAFDVLAREVTNAEDARRRLGL